MSGISTADGLSAVDGGGGGGSPAGSSGDMQINGGSGNFAAIAIAKYQTSAITDEAQPFASTVIQGITLNSGTCVGAYQTFGTIGGNNWWTMQYFGTLTAGGDTDFGAGEWSISQGDYVQGVYYILGGAGRNHLLVGNAVLTTTDGTLYGADLVSDPNTNQIAFVGDVPIGTASPAYWGGNAFPGTDASNTPARIDFQFIAPLGVD